MQQTLGITSILCVLSSIVFAVGEAAESGSKGRPIQVISDPYAVGNPTHYSVIKGTTKITFSHPLAGQFVRAEISVREKNGTKTTRFVLSRDGKAYRPTLQLETPYQKHNSMADKDAVCIDPADPGPLRMVQLLNGKVNDGEEIAKKRDELTKAKFFDASCFEPTFSDEHRNAIFNATADVLTTSTQDTTPEPKYLRCLEKFGFAHEAGIVQALVKQSISDTKVNPRIRITCTADKKAKPGNFDDMTREASIKKTVKPVREDYAVKVFHELLHAAPVPDGTPLAAMEECCTQGAQCEVLKAYAAKRKDGERKISLAEAFASENAVATAEITALQGELNDSLLVGKKDEVISQFEKASFVELTPTAQCRSLGLQACANDSSSGFARVASALQCNLVALKNDILPTSPVNYMLSMAFPTTYAADQEVKPCKVLDGMLRDTLNRARVSKENITPEQALNEIPQTSPIEWAPQQAVPIRMANNGADASDATAEVEKPAPPSRTIASVSPLPNEAPQRQLGSARNRADVSSTSRASALVDTMENAARRVTQTLTPEKLELLKVDKNQIFSSSYKPKTEKPHYIVASSASSPIKVADIGDLKGLDFPNPFANVRQKVDRDTGLFTTIENQDRKGKNAPPIAAAKDLPTRAMQDDPNSRGNAITNNPLATSNKSASTSAANVRTPNSTKTYEFKTMDRNALIKFVTSGYRNLSVELENPELAAALVKNDIQILDHESRRIGSMKPKSIFIYRDDLGRLVQTRAEK